MKCMTDPNITLGRFVTVVHMVEDTKNKKQDDGRRFVKPLAVSAAGPGIEDVKGAVHVDFANKRIGGGVLGRGAVQEEIYFISHPETLIAKCICTQMTATSAITIMGAIRFSDHHGYASNFVYTRPANIPNGIPVDRNNVALTEMVAIDAIKYQISNVKVQYRPSEINREYIKAKVGFEALPQTDVTVPIVTGRWGSGDFNGDPTLKILIQVAAASATSRPIIIVKAGRSIARPIEETCELAEALRMTTKKFLNEVVQVVGQNASGLDKNGQQTSVLILKHFKQLARRAGINTRNSHPVSSGHGSHGHGSTGNGSDGQGSDGHGSDGQRSSGHGSGGNSRTDDDKYEGSFNDLVQVTMESVPTPSTGSGVNKRKRKSKAD